MTSSQSTSQRPHLRTLSHWTVRASPYEFWKTMNVPFIAGTQEVATWGQRGTKCETSVICGQREKRRTGSEQGHGEFHQWFLPTALQWFPWVSWAHQTPLGRKAAQLDLISRPCFPFRFATDLPLVSTLPQAGKEPGTTSR